MLKSGTSVSTGFGNCQPSLVTPSYTQQTAAAGNTTGIEPKVGDVFYLSLRIDFTISFDCAADFSSVLATLPNNVVPAISGSATTLCRRWGSNATGSQVNDHRAQNNCTANPSFNATTRQFSMSTVSSPALPDVGGYWFTGIRYPQESQSYTSVQLLVPIKATATMTSQPMSFLVCTVGTSCVTASVNMTITGPPGDADPPFVSLPGAPQLTAVGARVPFTVNDNPGGSYYLKVDTSTNPAFPVGAGNGRPCGLSDAVIYQSSANVPFTGQISSEIQFGDLQTGGTTCYLSPQTLYHIKVCSTSTSAGFAELNCRYSSFTTGAVNATMELPTTDPQPSTGLNALTRVLAGHPTGTTRVRRRFSAVGGAFTDASPTQAISQSTSSTSQVSQAVTLPDPWRAYDLQVCFAATQTACSTPVKYLAGAAHSDGPATAVTATGATVAGHPSSPFPAGTLSARIGTTNPGAADPLTALNQAATVSLGADGTSIPAASTSIPLTGLLPKTTYWWAACFDNPADAGIEDCGNVSSFTTAAVSDPSIGDPSLLVKQPKRLRLNAGKSAQIKVTVTNGGDAPAARVKLCSTVPAKSKKRLKTPSCASLGTITAGSSKVATINVSARKKAPRGNAELQLQAKWTSGSSAVVKVKVEVRR